MQLINYIKMPSPLTVLGLMYFVFALFNILSFLRSGYWRGILNGIGKLILTNFGHVIVIVLLTLLIVSFVDKPLSDLCKTRFYNTDLYKITDFISSLGEGWFVAGCLFTASMIMVCMNNYNNALVCRIALMTSIFAGLANAVLKFIFNRERPAIGDDEWHFFYFFAMGGKKPSDLLYAYNSMPSGHTITVVSALTVLFCYAKSKMLKWFLVFIGVLVGCSRVYTLNHWPSDVFVSTVIGAVVGYVGFNLNKVRFDV